MKKYDFKKILIILSIIVLALLSCFLLKLVFPNFLLTLKKAANIVLIPGFIALFISYLVEPITNALEKRLKMNKNTAVLTTIVITIVFLIALFVFIFVFLGNIMGELIVNLWVQIEPLVSNYIPKDTITSFDAFVENLTAILSSTDPKEIAKFGLKVIALLSQGISSIVNIVMIIVLVPVFLFFLLKEKKHIFRSIVKVLPRKYSDDFLVIGSESNDMIEKFFKGRILSMTIMSIIFSVIFFMFGLGKYSILFGVLIGFLDIIPYLGPAVGVMLPVVYMLSILDSFALGIWMPIIFVIVNFLLQFFQQNILQPKIMGKEIEIHPLTILVSILFFGNLLGIVGLLVAVPISGTIKVIYQFYKKKFTAEEVEQTKDEVIA